MSLRSTLEQLSEYLWQIPRHGQMRVPGIIVADESMLQQIFSDEAPQQVMNTACLPGIRKYAMAMPDIHWGYGFPIGGVVATDVQTGVISPGGVGFDINCGVRLLRTSLDGVEVRNRLEDLVVRLYNTVPCGVGSHGSIQLSSAEVTRVLRKGARWAVEAGYGWQEDLTCTEDEGCLEGADPSAVSPRAIERGREQLGTLGSGNHFLEVQVVDTVFDPECAEAFGLFEGQVTVMIHSGSRGLGYQVCEDYARTMYRCMASYGITVPDRQLACAPLTSSEGKAYLAAMRAAANFAYANRQCMTHWVREAMEHTFHRSAEDMQIHLVYDVTHNTAKIEDHVIDGRTCRVCVHRKGATRSLPPGSREIPERYRLAGQPVLVPGDMGRCSYVLAGRQGALDLAFGSTCHGAGRLLSRRQAVKNMRGRDLVQELHSRGIFVMSRGKNTLLEECPDAYKDVNTVVTVVDRAGFSAKVAKLRPIGVVKG